MTDEPKKIRFAPEETQADSAADEPEPAQDYAVGYKRPPVTSRFKPGQSGNPRGRPRGSQNLTTVLNRLLRKHYVIREGGRVLELSGLEILARGQFSKAAKGDHAALDRFVNVQKEEERSQLSKRLTSDISPVEAAKLYQRLIKGTE